MKILYGKPVADHIYNNLCEKIEKLKNIKIIPTLAVIIIGDKRESWTYVKMKQKMCNRLNIHSYIIPLCETVTEEICIQEIQKLNQNTKIHGILIQLPLPKHLNEDRILQSVSVNKDIDGFTNHNVSRLVLNSQYPFFKPCTPEGCVELLKYYGYSIEGKHAVVIGRSRIVGLPLAHLLLHENATVTVCHSKTENLERFTQSADLLFVGCGKPNFIKKNMIKKGVIIVDIGINIIHDKTKKKGYYISGDVDANDVCDKAEALTPVPKGIGPLTICMLMKHTVDAVTVT